MKGIRAFFHHPWTIALLLLPLAMGLSSCEWLFPQEGIDTTETVVLQELTRTYQVHIPAGYDDSESWPLLVVLHGSYQNIDDIKYITEFSTLADKQGFFALYPLAYEDSWNDGRAVQGIPAFDLNVDDVAFIRTALDRVIGSYKIDASRVYITGMSNGAMMTQRAVMAMPEKFAAFATVAGNMPQNLLSLYDPALAVPAMIIHGTDDPIVPYAGGVLNPSWPMGVVLSIPNTVAYWVENNGAGTTPTEVQLPNKEVVDKTTVFCDTYAPGEAGAEVVFYRVEKGGHSWPGSSELLAIVTDGLISQDFDASSTIWNFCKTHSRATK